MSFSLYPILNFEIISNYLNLTVILIGNCVILMSHNPSLSINPHILASIFPFAFDDRTTEYKFAPSRPGPLWVPLTLISSKSTRNYPKFSIIILFCSDQLCNIFSESPWRMEINDGDFKTNKNNKMTRESSKHIDVLDLDFLTKDPKWYYFMEFSW